MGTAATGKISLIDHARTRSAENALRAAERFTLMMRVAKIACTYGEYACVIRDVSTTGIKLRLFHRMPSEKHVALELANGDRYFLENVWEADHEAGFRFSAPVDVNAFVAEEGAFHRRQIRLRTNFPATLGVKGDSSHAVITNLSREGAQIECGRVLAVDQHVRLNAPHLPEIFGSVRWKSGANYGLVFQRSFGLDELARIVWALHEPADNLAAQSAARLSPGVLTTGAQQLRAG